ncbi:MAG: single-stranded-DNA-specific exonuclease RecJ [Desulfobacterales bacterium]
MKKEWKLSVPDPQVTGSLVKSLNCHPVTATVLANRSILSHKAALDFFSNSFDRMKPPFSLTDSDRAADRIVSAVMQKEPILIFGDYDADGITATVVLYDFLRYVGADVDYYIPHRVTEGYGLSAAQVTNVAVARGIRVIITVDCGMSSHDAVETANSAGIDVIITDHHHVPEQLPRAFAVVNPNRTDCPSNLTHLAGVGVAFYLVVCLRKKLRDMSFFTDKPEPNLKDYCDLVAIGTIADMVPIIGENRILTRAGLDMLGFSNRIGLMSLFESSGLDHHFITAEDVAFRLAPRLNAAGRLDHARMAVELFTCSDSNTARRIAQDLDQLNGNRRTIETKIFDEIVSHLHSTPRLMNQKSLCLYCEAWHEGVLGIVASRLARRFARPTVLATLQNGVAKGSGRSSADFNLYEGLAECADLLENFGGHAMAAGLTLKPENFLAFKEKFESIVHDHTTGQTPAASFPIDCELRFDMITGKLMDEMDRLQPFGIGNEEPLFLARNIRIRHSQVVGNQHRRLILKQMNDPTGKSIQGIHFNAPKNLTDHDYAEVLFRLRWNRWNGNKTIQLIIEDACPAE